MNTGAILNIDFVAEPDKIYIAANDGIEPGTALISHDYIANNGGIGGNETINSKLRTLTFYGENDWHNVLFKCCMICRRAN
jgi:hypothetical protein